MRSFVQVLALVLISLLHRLQARSSPPRKDILGQFEVPHAGVQRVGSPFKVRIRCNPRVQLGAYNSTAHLYALGP